MTSKWQISIGKQKCGVFSLALIFSYTLNSLLHRIINLFLALIFFSVATVGLIELVWCNGNAIKTCKPTSVEIEIRVKVIFTTGTALYFQIWGTSYFWLGLCITYQCLWLDRGNFPMVILYNAMAIHWMSE